jgi:DNA-directed RNA polymerase subunit RPC12/RpoP
MSHPNMEQFLSLEEKVERNRRLAEAGLQHCPICRKDKELTAFAPAVRGNCGHYCRECKKAKNRERYLEKGRFEKPAQHRERTYGLEPGEYARMLKDQGYRCAICSRSFIGLKPQMIHVDHDHRTGVVRGILCQNCNNGCAALLDDPDLVINACVYIAKAKERNDATALQVREMRHGGSG